MIDLRSDTVTKPCAQMRQAMYDAEVGDDVTFDDPTVNRLQDYAAELTGKEMGLFMPSGTQANLAALMAHCQRGDEYIVGQQAHCYLFEGGGAAVLGSLQPQPLLQEPDGSLDLAKVKGLIKADNYHFARTRLLCQENTTWGKVLPMDYLAQSRAFCDTHQLAHHLDGARLFNAAVALDVSAKEIAQYFDSVSFCLSKGLGAPVGSLLVGDKDFIIEARRWRKMLGGGLRQAGVLAGAGLYALEHNVEGLALDHQRAEYLTQALKRIDGLGDKVLPAQTNMVFMTLPEGKGAELADFLAKQNICIYPGDSVRMVMHRDLSDDDIERVIGAFSDFCC